MEFAPVITRIMMPSPNAQPVEGAAGLVLVGIRPHDGFPGLVLIWDEAQDNHGASATNSIETILPWLQRRWPEFPLREAVLVERDSDGAFDHAYPQWLSREGRAVVHWKPLRWVGAQARTQDAFVGIFGAGARAALKAVSRVTAVK